MTLHHADSALEQALIEALSFDDGVRRLLGTPPRLFAGEPRQPAYPYAVLERHERLPAGASDVAGAEHKISLAVYTRHGGRAEARDVLAALRQAAETADLDISGLHVVLLHAVYSDTMRTADRSAFRGLLRLRVITEEV